MFDVLSSRELGQYPLSIATSLAMESVTGIHPEINRDTVLLQNYDTLWLNTRTLFRNVRGAAQGVSGFEKVTPEEYAEVMINEIESIIDITSNNTNGKTKVMLYYSNYAKVEHMHKHAQVRKDNTDIQKAYTALSKKVHSALFKLIRDMGLPFTGVDDIVDSKTPSKNLFLTNYAYDLLAHNSLFGVTLLESHTGAVKPKAMWHTKFVDGKSLPMIPFNRLFMQIFGDKETFKPMDKKLRNDIIEIAKKYRWNNSTTASMIDYGIRSMKNHYAVDVIRDMRH